MSLEEDNEFSLTIKEHVNGIFSNIDNSLISLATNHGYRIFSSSTFYEVSHNDPVTNQAIGSLKIAIPLYQSSIILLVGLNQSSPYTDNQLVLWNEEIKTQEASLTFNGVNKTIISSKIAKEGIFVAFSSEIKVFDIITLKHVLTIKDVYYSSNAIAMAVNSKDSLVTLIDICSSNKSNIKLTSLLYDNNTMKIKSKSEATFTTPFPSIYKYTIDEKGKFIAVVSNINNKIHIYSVKTRKMIYCFDIEMRNMRINSITIEKKGKFIAVLYANWVLEIYEIGEKNCSCFSNEEITTSRLDKLCKRKQRCFHRYKYPNKYLDEIISGSVPLTNNGIIISFLKKGELNIIDYHGLCHCVKFSTTVSDNIWCYREMKFTTEEE